MTIDELLAPVCSPAMVDALCKTKQLIGRWIWAIAPVGSDYILGEGADVDVLVRVSNLSDALDALADSGFEPDGTYIGTGVEFTSMRKEGLNIILTTHASFFDGFVTAAKVCRYLKIEDKADRVAIHRFLRDGEELPGIDF